MNIPLLLLMQNIIWNKRKEYQKQDKKDKQNIETKITQEDYYNSEQLSL